ncbi:hypothetical protein NQ318_004594 [Aromia moschata]|uniref:GRAM domain-containing protein n=1 Tax=Aromia moschata TaxID=1265417 RepID=A0AAV8XQR6_9CUCU|nr:hypothetical protein NQ318_004594 [Aromia moschata]
MEPSGIQTGLKLNKSRGRVQSTETQIAKSYIGDGDSKTSKATLDLDPYNNDPKVMKKERVGHMEKNAWEPGSVMRRKQTRDSGEEILIPILSVEKITKEKTAKILPNAIGITTCESTRYVFGSLISRDNTLKYVTKVWEKVKSETPLIVDDELMEDVFNESEQDESGVDSSYPSNDIQYKGQQNDRQTAPKVIVETKSYFIRIPKIPRIMKLPRPGLVLTATTVLLIILYLTATILLYRINQIEHRYSQALHGLSHADSNIIYPDLLKWQAELHSKTNDAVYGYIDSNLVEIAKIRQSLEKLSSLLVTKEDPLKASFPERNII